MPPLLTLCLCILLFSTGDYFAARWGQSRGVMDLSLALSIGPFAYLVFGYLVANNESLARMASFVCCGIVLCSSLAGVLFFDERLNRTSWLGIFVIVFGIALLGVGKVSKV